MSRWDATRHPPPQVEVSSTMPQHPPQKIAVLIKQIWAYIYSPLGFRKILFSLYYKVASLQSSGLSDAIIDFLCLFA